MATIITKNSSTASSVPSAAQLVQGELAVNVTDRRLFTENSGGTVVELGTNPSSLTLPNGTANGVAYLNGSKVLTTGSALTYNGAAMQINAASFPALKFGDSGATLKGEIYYGVGGNDINIVNYANGPIGFIINGSEQMRLTSTGLGIGTSSPSGKLDVTGSVGTVRVETTGNKISFTRNGANYISAAGGSSVSLNYDAPVHNFNSGDGATTRMTLNDSGNLGLGVTPSAWGSYLKAFQISSGALAVAPTDANLQLINNGYFDGTNWLYQRTDFSAKYDQVNGIHAWYTAPSGTAGNAISFTQAMTLDASGNLGVGTTTPQTTTASYPSTWMPASQVYGATNAVGIIRSGTGEARLHLSSGGASANQKNWFIAASTAGALTFTSGADNLTGTERARIDSSGNWLVNTTSTFASSKATIKGAGNTLTVWEQNGSSAAALICRVDITSGRLTTYNYNGSDVGTVTTNGTSTSYNTSSDYRLKEDIAPMTGALAKVAALKPCTYKWKADGSDGEGFIAHELAEVVPQCVTGEKDAVDAEGNPVYQGIDTSFLVATLTAAIQELKAEFDAYKASHP